METLFLKQHRNTLLATIQNQNFDPQLFTLEELEHGWSESHRDYAMLIVRLRNTKMYFALMRPPDDYTRFQCLYVPFNPNLKQNGPFPLIRFTHFEEVHNYFRNTWLPSLKLYISELKTTDAWSQLSNYITTVSSSTKAEPDTTPLSKEDIEQIQLSMQRFKLLITEALKPTEEEIKTINKRLDYLTNTNTTKRLNRFDWGSALMKTLLTLATDLTLNPEKGQQLYILCKQAFESAKHLIQ